MWTLEVEWNNMSCLLWEEQNPFWRSYNLKWSHW